MKTTNSIVIDATLTVTHGALVGKCLYIFPYWLDVFNVHLCQLCHRQKRLELG